MENLIRENAWYNPMTVITDNNNVYELDNIIIYSEDGVLIETKKVGLIMEIIILKKAKD